MEKLCIHYGTNLGSLNDDNHIYYDFPHPARLADPSVEQNLRQLGFGYRAKYIQTTAHMIANVKPRAWLSSLREKSYPETKESLLELSGVGPKVADCVVYPHFWTLLIKVFVLIRSTICCTRGHPCLADCCARLQVQVKREESREYDKRCLQRSR